MLSSRTSPRAGSGSRMYSCDPLPLQVVGFEQHAPAESLVPLDVAGDRLGRPQVGRRDVDERHRRAERLAVGAEPRDRARFELPERADVERRPLAKPADAAAQNPASLGQHRRPTRRRAVTSSRARSTSSRSMRSPSSSVTREPSRQRSCANTASSAAVTLLRRSASPGTMRSASEPSRRRISTGRLTLVPSYCESWKSRPNLNRCCPRHLSTAERERLDPLHASDVALLIVEEAALLRLRRVDHRLPALGVHVDLEPPARQRAFEHHASARSQSDPARPPTTPFWLNSGVTSGGRNVFIVRCSILRGNITTRPPSVCRGDSTPSMRVNESKLVSPMSGSPGRLFTGSLT